MSDVGEWAKARQDVARYGGWGALWREQSLWAVLWFRLGCGLNKLPTRPLRKLALVPWWLGFRLLETLVGVSLPLGVQAGGGVRIWHFGGIFIHPNTVMGRNVTLRQGVTLGNRHSDGKAPIIGDDVEFGAYAQVLGPVQIGRGARVGAMSVVLQNVPEGYTAVGAPARLVPPGSQSGERA